jgi:hypothetical protein
MRTSKQFRFFIVQCIVDLFVTRTLVGIRNTGALRVSLQVMLSVDESRAVFSVLWFTIDTLTLVRASTKTV